MAEKIQRIPAGLLDALGIKSVGRNPNALSDEIAGVVDLLSLYESSLIDVEASSSALTAVADDVVLTVPAGEAWDLISVQGGCSVTTGTVTQNCAFAVGITIQGAFIRLGSSIVPGDVGAGNRFENGFMLPKRTLLAPGSLVRCRMDLDTGSTFTNISVTVGALFFRLRV